MVSAGVVAGCSVPLRRAKSSSCSSSRTASNRCGGTRPTNRPVEYTTARPGSPCRTAIQGGVLLVGARRHRGRVRVHHLSDGRCAGHGEQPLDGGQPHKMAVGVDGYHGRAVETASTHGGHHRLHPVVRGGHRTAETACHAAVSSFTVSRRSGSSLPTGPSWSPAGAWEAELHPPSRGGSRPPVRCAG